MGSRGALFGLRHDDRDLTGIRVTLPEFAGDCDCGDRYDGKHMIDLHGSTVRGELVVPRKDMVVKAGNFSGLGYWHLRFWSRAGWAAWLGIGWHELRHGIARRIAP